MAKEIKWGIVGPGMIAARFADALSRLGGEARLYAVASRDIEKAKAFGAKYGADKAYGSYEEMFSDPDVDAVYVCTPHAFHKQHTIAALSHGKPVLCEKPFTIEEKDAIEMTDAAAKAGKPLMEAMWSRFMPGPMQARKWVREGAIGEPRMIIGATGFRINFFNPEARLYAKSLGGGALLDMGCYAVSLAHYMFGMPERVKADMGVPEPTGVDGHNCITLAFPSGALAMLSSGMRTQMPSFAKIYGTDGWIDLPEMNGTRATLHNGRKTVEFSEPLPPNYIPFCLQIREFCSMVREGRLQSDIMPHVDTIEVMRIMDMARESMGLDFNK